MYNFETMEVEKYWQPNKKVDMEDLLQKLVYSDEYIAARKADGHFYMFIKREDGIIMRGRAKSVKGVYTNKIAWLPQIEESLKDVPINTVLLGEIHFPNNEGSKNVTTIMACKIEKAIERQKKNPLYFYIFDCLSWGGTELLNTPIIERIKFLERPELQNKDYILIAKYVEKEEIFALIEECKRNSKEGVVLQLKDSLYEPGGRRSYKTVKVKKEIERDIDCFFTGNYKDANIEYTGKEVENWTYWYNIKSETFEEGFKYLDSCNGEALIPVTKGHFNGWAGSLEIGVYDKKRKVVIPIAWISSIPDEIKAEIKLPNNKWIKHPLKISAMERDPDSGNYRHAKIVEYRSDISWEDCTLDKMEAANDEG